jgi:carbon storage regulator CsrA
MLVLSRRPDETILFPNAGITLRLLRIRGKVVSLGIEAPDHIRVVRGEVAAASESEPLEAAPPEEDSAPSLHQLRNDLNTISLTVQYVQQLLESGSEQGVEQKLADLLNELETLDERLAETEQTRDEAPETSKPPAGLRVLVVEDDENERSLLAHLLALKGCHVETASDGNEALAYLCRNERPDFVLLDMGMPRCDGPEFLSTIRKQQQFRDLKVFAVSGKTARATGVPVGENGVDGWFRKPLNAKRLLDSMFQAGSGASSSS